MRDLKPGTDLYGDPLPPGAIARLGSIRLRHQDYVSCIAFSPDGRLLASGAGHNDGKIRLWDAATGQPLLCFYGGGGGIYSLAFSPDGRLIASGGENRAIHLWDAGTGVELACIENTWDMLGSALSLAFSPDGGTLALGTEENVVLLETRTGKVLLLVEGKMAVAFSPGGAHLATGTGVIADATTGASLARLSKVDETTHGIAFSPDGKHLALCGSETLRVWDTAGWTMRLEIPGPWYSVNFSRSPGILVVTGKSGVRLLETATGRILHALEGSSSHAVFSPDGRRLASAWNNAIVLEDVSGLSGTKSDCRSVGWIDGVQYSSDGQSILSWDRTGMLRRWDDATGLETGRHPVGKRPRFTVFAPDGRQAAVVDLDNEVRILDTLTGAVRARLIGTTVDNSDRVVSNPANILVLAFAPNGLRVASAEGRTVTLWSVATGQRLRSFSIGAENEKDHPVRDLVFSPDGRRVAVARSVDVTLWDAETGRQQACSPEGASLLAFSPDGNRLATWDTEKLLLRSGQDANVRLRIPTGYADVDALAFSPDGTRVAAGRGRRIDYAERSVDLWDAESGVPLFELSYEEPTVRPFVIHELGSTYAVDHGCMPFFSFSPDGSRIASGMRNGTVLVWDVSDRARLAAAAKAGSGDATDAMPTPLERPRFHIRGGNVQTVNAPRTRLAALSADGKTLVMANTLASICLRDVATGKARALFPGLESTDLVTSLAFSPDARTLASLDRNGHVLLRDAGTGRVHSTLAVPPGGFVHASWELAFSRDGKRLAAGATGSACVWSLDEGVDICRIGGFEGPVDALDFSADGRLLATWAGDKPIRIWDVATGKETLRLPEDNRGSALAFSPDGKTLAAGGASLRLWDTATGQVRVTCEGHEDTIRSLSYSSDGRRLLSGSEDGTIRLWDASTGRELARLDSPEGPVSSASLTPDGQSVLSIADDGTVRLRRIDGQVRGFLMRGDPTEEKQETPASPSVPDEDTAAHPPDAPQPAPRPDAFGDPMPPGAVQRLGTTRLRHRGDSVQAVFSPDGALLASCNGDMDGTLALWETTTGRNRYLLNLSHPARNLEPLEFGPSCVAFSPDGQRLATGHMDGDVRLVEAATGRAIAFYRGRARYVQHLSFSPDGSLLASTASEGVAWTIHLRSLKERRDLHHLDMPSRIVNVSFTPDGKTLVSAEENGTIRLWSVEAGAESGRWTAHDGKLSAMALARGRSLVATGAEDGTLRCWELPSGKRTIEIPGQGQAVNALLFSPSGDRLYAAHRDRLLIRDVATGEIIRAIPGCAGTDSMALSPDGRILAVMNHDHRAIRLIDTASGNDALSLPGHVSEVKSVTFSPDGRILASGGTDGTLRIWDLLKGSEQTIHRGNTIGFVQFTPDGKLLLSLESGKPALLRAWDTATWKQRHQREWSDKLHITTLSPDGSLLAGCVGDDIHILETATGQERLAIPSPERMFSLAFSSDERLLAGRGEKAIHVWEVAGGRRRHEIRTNSPFRLQFLPGNEALVSVCALGCMRIDLATGRVQINRSHQASRDDAEMHAGYLAMTTDQRLAAKTTGYASPIHLIEMATGHTAATLPTGSVEASCAGYSPDGTRLATGMADGSILLWDVSAVHARAGRLAIPSMDNSPEALWKDLAGDDTRNARLAIGSLSGLGDNVVPYLRDQLKPATPSPEKARLVARLIADLDDDVVDARDQATRRLSAMGAGAEAALREASEKELSLEARLRLEPLLTSLTIPLPIQSTDAMRRYRAMQVLERIGSKEAREALEMLEKESPSLRERNAAKASLERLSKHR